MPNCASTTSRPLRFAGGLLGGFALSFTLSLALSFIAPDGADAAEHAAQHATERAAPRKARAELGSSAAFAPDGRLYAVGKDGEHVVLYRSTDLGQTWSAPTTVNAEPEKIAADGEGRPKLAFAKDGALLVSWVRPLGKPYSGEVRLARADSAERNGERFAAPITVHRDRSEITHRFESLTVAGDGRVVLAWIDKRDQEKAKATKTPYRGAAIYAAVSHDGGRTFQAETKIADHSCECCRLAGALDADGTPLLMWRHVFAPNERDHALARLPADSSPASAPARILRATFDRWRVDGCPHHGPSLAVDRDGTRHAVWFNQKDGEGRVFYGRLVDDAAGLRVAGQRPLGGPRAEHADIGAAGQRVAVAWKEFDGEKTQLRAELSEDGGQTFRPVDLANSTGATDQPRVLLHGEAPYIFWRSEAEGMRVFALR